MPRPTRGRTSLPGHARAAKLMKEIDALAAAQQQDEFGDMDMGDEQAAEMDEPEEEPEVEEAEVEATRPPTKMKKADKAFAKREALIAKITAGQNPYSKSHARRVKRAAKPENNLVTSLSAVEDALARIAPPPVAAQPSTDGEWGGISGQGAAAATSAPLEKGKEKLTAKKRQRVLSSEAARLPAVMSNPAFTKDPFATIRLHTLNTLQTANNVKGKPKK